MTFFSGFGLGTILTPVMAIFFPLEVAIALTGIVHLLNNLFKFSLVFREIDKDVLLKFGLTAIFGAFLGAFLLGKLSEGNILYQYNLSGKLHEITIIKVVIASLLCIFVFLESSSKIKKIQLEAKYLPFGGILSGFFGGLSGNQGALRSMFLVKAGLSKESFIATGIAIACLIDITRLLKYSQDVQHLNLETHLNVLIFATLSAFLGAYLGRKLLKKVSIQFVQICVAVLLLIIAVLLGSGII
jgi:uncharacterized membrane protein YfcA